MDKKQLEEKLAEVNKRILQLEVAYNQLIGRKTLLEELVKESK